MIANPKSRGLSARRIALLATTIAGLTAGAYFVAPALTLKSPDAMAQNLSQEARAVARPVGFADIVEKVKPAVISVRVKLDSAPRIISTDELPFPKGSPMEQFFRRFGMPEGVPNAPRGGRGYATGQGSGFLISSDGFAVTNNHVVEKATDVEVTFDDGKSYPAKVIGTDPRTDLALIKIEGGNFPYVKLADAAPRVGDWVLAVGNPFGLGGTVTAGIVSARGRDIGAGPYDDFLQIDAPVNKGNSGGPTFNVEGSVIGVNTAIFSPSGGSVGIAFAIPAETVKTVIAQLKDKGVVTRGWIGVQIQPVTKDIADSLGLKKAEGALVADPQKDGPAFKAGIEAGDVIVSVEGAAVRDARDLAKKIAAIAPGTSIKLGVIRKGTEKSLTLTLGVLPAAHEARAERRDLRPDSDEDARGVPDRTPRRDRRGDRSDRDVPGAAEPRLGLSLAPAGSEPGVVVAEVDPVSPVADLIRAGDVIVDVGGRTVSSPADFRKALGDARAEGKRSVLVRVKSERRTRFVAIPLGQA
jgi:serine protease Do